MAEIAEPGAEPGGVRAPRPGGGRSTIRQAALGGLIIAVAGAAVPARAHDIYLMNDNHTDYGWNASTAEYDAVMARELDYYLDQIRRTRTQPPESQARFNADSWWYLRNYELHRPAKKFRALIAAIRSGHITVPLNPFVMLYGALPTEAAIRAGYYPGRMGRKYGIEFRLAQNMENTTTPWGVASLWAGSGVEFTWKGICGCGTKTSFRDRHTQVFRWQGPDGSELIKKWYTLDGLSTSFGGYAEARDHLTWKTIRKAIQRTDRVTPGLPVTGLFGAGWDDVEYKTDLFTRMASAWNRNQPLARKADGTADRVIVSNGIDYFEALKPYVGRLPVLRGGWGNDWDLDPARLARWTARMRNAIEEARTAEMLMVLAGSRTPGLWDRTMPPLQDAYTNVFKYFEHSWWGISKPLEKALYAHKEAWTDDFAGTVAEAERAAAEAASVLFDAGGVPGIVVVNPLGFARTDYVDIAVPQGGPVHVVDAESGAPAPSQIMVRGERRRLRFLARDVPGLGYRRFGLEAGAPEGGTAAASVAGSRIESARYAVTVGTGGEIVSAVDKRSGRDMAGGPMNAIAGGRVGSAVAENVGPVSATLRVDIEATPPRRVRITLFRDLGRIEIENEILGRPAAETGYAFTFGFTRPAIHFEEVGAIARPGLVTEGGNFLPGTNAKYMTLNHFVNMAGGGFNVTLSNRDAFAMRIGDSTPKRFDLPTNRLTVLAVGDGRADQGGARHFVNRFALAGRKGPFSAVASMRLALAHQNPLRAIAIAPGARGPLKAPAASLVKVKGAEDVVVTAFKPAEEADRGYVLRLWELGGQGVRATVDARGLGAAKAFETSLIETDRKPLAGQDGRFVANVPADGMTTIRLQPGETPR